jgi:hypothetical protein
MIAAIVGAAGIAMSASAQQSSSKSCTTISSSCDDGSYEVRLENGELIVVKVDGKKVDLGDCNVDKDAGHIVIDIDGREPFVVDISGVAGITSGLTTTSPIAAISSGSFFPGQIGTTHAPEPIQWADVPDAPDEPDLPGNVFFDDGTHSSWAFDGDEPRVMIGITHDEVDEDHRVLFDLDEGEGIFVIDVRGGLPAEQAGVQAGDIIVEVDGEFLDDRDILKDILGDSEPGDKLRVVVLRQNEDGDIIKKKLRLKLAEYNGFVLRGGEANNMWTTNPEGNMRFHIETDGEDFAFDRLLDLEDLAEFPDSPEINFFREFDFELPEELEEMEPEVREEIMRAIEMARERAHDTRERAFELRINRESQARHMQEDARQLQREARQHLQEFQNNQELHGDHGEHAERLHEHLARLQEHGMAMHELNEAELEKLREHGLNVQIHLDEELDRLQHLELKLHELGSNEQIIRSAPGGRAFIIERHSDGVPEVRGERRERSDTDRLRIERDDLRNRNHELEDRVEALERKLEALMKKLEESR